MVSYTEWTAIVFELVGDEDATEVISWASDRWNERKSDLEDATTAEAREWARGRL
jgi:hypothetical protein